MVHLKTAMAVVSSVLLTGCVIQFDAAEDYEENFGISNQSDVVFVGIDGDVFLKGTDDQNITIRGTKHAMGNTKSRARENLKYAELDASTSGTALILEFSPPSDVEMYVDLELDKTSTMPFGMGTEISVESGDISVDGVEGNKFLRTDDGDIEVEAGGEGIVRIEAMRGSVSVTSSGEMDISAEKGAKIIAKEVNNSPITVETDDSDIVLYLELQDYTIYCYPDGGEIDVDQSLEPGEPNTSEDDLVRYTRGTGSKKIVLRSAGGNIVVKRGTEKN